MHIDLDKLLDYALRGVRRASVFLGLGVNASLDPEFKSYQLTDITNIQLVPDGVSDERIENFKEEFRLWIEAAGFRELAETFATYLDEVHYVCLLLEGVPRHTPATDLKVAQANFSTQGVPNKVNILQQRFGVELQHRAHLVSLGRARNCLVHRQGIVGDTDLAGKPDFVVTWPGVDLFIEEPSGNRTAVEQENLPLFLPEGGTVCIQRVERERSFTRGEKLLLSTRDLAEICWFYEREARMLLKEVVAHAERAGVTVSPPKT